MTDAPATWDPRQYERFAAERDRPARELLARLPAELDPAEIWDLGCGPGRQAASLKRRFPQARVHGLDSSAAMIEQARGLRDDVDWTVGDIGTWAPDHPVDLILANASLHWLPDHEALIARLAACLAPGGVLAVQMPQGYETRHHEILREVAGQWPWADALATVEQKRPLLAPEAYHDLMSPLCAPVEVWTTTYLHALTGANPVLEWLKGAALRPYLSRLSTEPELETAFLAALGEALSNAFPPRLDGTTLLPFPRLFLVARRRGGGEGR